MNFTQKLTTGLATGTALATVFSSAAFATNVNVSGNGFSSNHVAVVESNNTFVSQNNTQVVTNVVSSSANTGGNTSAFNMGGSITHTGAATSTVTNTTTGNGNVAEVGCGCPTTPTNVRVTGNVLSHTNVGVVKMNNTVVGQNNTQIVTNVVKSQANSGKNGSYLNMGFGGTGTGPATSTVTNTVYGSGNVLK